MMNQSVTVYFILELIFKITWQGLQSMLVVNLLLYLLVMPLTHLLTKYHNLSSD